MTGEKYADLVAAYLVANFGNRGASVYREVSVGKSIIGKNRRLDVLVVVKERALAIECKFQQKRGTTDEKIPYAIRDVESMWIPAVVAYAGDGWSDGIRHMLQASELAAYCLPKAPKLARSAKTRELDHVLAEVFGWWDVITTGKSEFDLDAWRARQKAK